MSQQVSFVGAGPGAADLITIRGARLLRHADVIIFAGSLVDRELVRRYARTEAVYDSAGMTLTEVITVIMDAIAAGKSVVRLHTGDPSIYGAIQEQMEALDRLGIEYEVIPGVTSAVAAPAYAGIPITHRVMKHFKRSMYHYVRRAHHRREHVPPELAHFSHWPG